MGERQLNSVVLECELRMLENFLDRVAADAERELDSIEQGRLAGEFHGFEDYE